MLSANLPILSTILSLFAFFFSVYAFRRSYRASIQPVLVFSNATHSPNSSTSWIVENVGKGPAINLLLTGGDSKCQWDNEEWTRIPVLSVGAHERLEAFRKRQSFIVFYADALGTKYCSTCVNNTNSIKRIFLQNRTIPRRHLFELRRKNLKNNSN